ncbi:hypothetical protein [Thaumasiovibrio sp. DFM-14]|uniref:hypothetical protein n=1 Tax=Thaumasiovibrio sp. DFM-14 TaxID=3384792 RepID=UPI00399FB397
MQNWISKKARKVAVQLIGVSLFAWAGSMGVVNHESQILSILGLAIFFYGFAMKAEVASDDDNH